MRQKVYPELSGWLQGNNIGSCLLRVRIGNSWNPPSLQDYVTLRKVMIKLQYQRMHLFLREEEQFHLEALEKEAKETGRDLKESVFRMTQQKETLKEMYSMLTELCRSPDTELLQVRRGFHPRERKYFSGQCCPAIEMSPACTLTLR